MQRNWTTVGAETVERAGGQEAVETAIAGLEWTTETRVAFMPGAAINAAIEQLELPRVSRIALSAIEVPPASMEEDGFYPGFYGIECSYGNGLARVYVLDTGTSIDVACTDFYDAEGGEVEKQVDAVSGRGVWALREGATA